MTWLNNLGALDWGNVPTWIGALGSAGALIIALVLLRGELAARRRSEEHYARQQVGAVSLWVEWAVDDRGLDPPEVVISNRSDAAIYDCKVTTRKGVAEKKFVWRLPVAPPTEEPVRRSLSTLPLDDAADQDYRDTMGLPIVEMTFADVYGRRWSVSSRGDWKQLSDNDKSTPR